MKDPGGSWMNLPPRRTGEPRIMPCADSACKSSGWRKAWCSPSPGRCKGRRADPIAGTL